LGEITRRHSGELQAPDIDDHQHYTRWTSATFVQMCSYYGFNVIRVQDPDDKVGNGFTIIIDVAPSLASRVRGWGLRQTMKLRLKAASAIAPAALDR
jgi:hypothetical protein